MDYQEILYAVDDGVAVVRFNRPKVYNAITGQMLAELDAAFSRAAADAAVRAIVLTGEGKAFCSGADLAASLAMTPRDAQGRLDPGQALEDYYNPLILKMRALPKPIISAVNGIAAGAGANLGLMADITVCARSAYFLQAFVNIGLIPDAGGTWLLPRLVGQQRAMGMAMLGEKLSSEKALAWGLVWDVVDDEQLLPTAMAIAHKLANGPAAALERIKQAVYASDASTLPESLQLERRLQGECGHYDEFTEGVNAFLEKRKPVYRR
ncbi:2-(1,2-epoxy-1,2-dihydrophenyl)acetyl-CoA isomerase [Solimonas sp. K1W22B-7]|uniref:enoyl-CoA hydratase-related protein n=1 Tax=Solimonas sp. K1W22B-7 TaxID=2303331 RepID=UPI000E334F7D|nr:enoyl-CoA hydratase-related protein [Solimonas sp. K1W22B-7]AXQ31317.1 2-(1,2-epoxy-1,2-dihydrophenyl)acetyl-CoA isomerase [Solimonas sp. K1W22B-7]